jgi:hypothetical protein
MKAALADRGYFAPISLWGFYGSGRRVQEPSTRQAA